MASNELEKHPKRHAKLWQEDEKRQHDLDEVVTKGETTQDWFWQRVQQIAQRIHAWLRPIVPMHRRQVAP